VAALGAMGSAAGAGRGQALLPAEAERRLRQLWYVRAT
jgi:hypothetical protein